MFRFFTCFILASSLRVWSSLRRSFLFPTRIMGTLGQKCFTSGVHFSGMFSKEGDTSSQKRDTATGDMQARRLISGGETYSWSSMTMLVWVLSGYQHDMTLTGLFLNLQLVCLLPSYLSNKIPVNWNYIWTVSAFRFNLPRLSGLSMEKHMRMTSVSG